MASTNETIIREALEAYEQAQEAENDNRECALEDLRFARLDEQWPEEVANARKLDNRPMLTINRMPSFIRQVVNDARQNKPSIKVHPVDSGADPETAEVINGLIRNIEASSHADIAYDTAVECGVSMGFGYMRVGVDYAFEDAFDLDISIDPVPNPFSVYGDPRSTTADGSDWDVAFVIDKLAEPDFEKRFPKADKVDFKADDIKKIGAPWFDDDGIQIAEYWTREEYDKPIVLMSDGTVLAQDDEDAIQLAGLQGITVVRERIARCRRVKQRIINGVDILDETDWMGRYIPIVPVYGEEVNVEGKRHFRSLVRPAKDAQRMYNYWRTTSTELVALAPQSPFIGPISAFESDAEKWATANRVNHAYIGYDGDIPPQRQGFAGPPAGAIQEALNASDDMKAIMGIYDASLGARSNETSGRAIMARQREGDVSTFHFIDNMARSIRQVGRIVLDLIPHVYSHERVLRVLGEDGRPASVTVNTEQKDEVTGAVVRMHDLTAGKYDLTVSTGPSFTSQREEAATMITEMIRAYPDAAPVLGGLLAKNFDWPGADEVARRLEAMAPPQVNGELPPQVMQMIEEGKQRIAELEAENQSMKADRTIDAEKVKVDQHKAETDRIKAEAEIARMEWQMSQPPQVDRLS